MKRRSGAARASGAIALGFALATAAPAMAAPRPMYGGRLVVDAPSPDLDPSAPARDVATWLVRLHALEPLYEVRPGGELEPVLAAGPPRITDGALIIPVRSGVMAHDGSSVDVPAIARWLETLRTAAGRPERFGGLIAGPVTPHGPDEVRVPWAGGMDAAVSALGDPALRWWAGPPDGAIGTGPFRVDRGTGLALTPRATHRAGRPFLDAVEIGPAARGPEAAHVQPDPAGPFEAAWYLAVGPEVRTRHPDLPAALDGAIERGRLLGRFGAAQLRPAPGERPGAPAVARVVDRSLLALDALPADYVERLQLELARLGVRVVVERVPASVLDARRRDGAFDFLLDRVVEPRARASDEPSNPTAPHARLRQLFGPETSTGDLVDLGVIELARGRLAVVGPPLSSAAWLDLANAWIEPAGEPAP